MPDEGHVFIGGDYSGIEWGIAMWFCSKLDANGPHLHLLDRFYAGDFDPHVFLASKAFSTDEASVDPLQRQMCKPYTHGYFFGGTPRGLAIEVGHPVRVGKAVCAAHDREFQGEDFRKKTYERAKRSHYIQTPLGWRRYFWGSKPKPQEILGTLVQATAADLCKWVLIKIFAEEPEWVEIITTCHDSYLLQVAEDKAGAGRLWLKEMMEQPIPWLDNRRWRADIKQGMSWKDVS